MKRIHFVIVAQEGIVSVTCGVGMVVANLVSAFPNIIAGLSGYAQNAKVSVITLSRDKNSIGYDARIGKQSQNLCRKFGGKIHFIKSKFRPRKGYFDIPVWKQYNKEARNIIGKIKSGDETIVVLHHDIIFGDLQNLGKDIYSVWIPHSMANVHRQKYSDIEERLAWENRLVKRVASDSRSYIGYISDYARRVMALYNVPENKLIDFANGFSAEFLDSYRIGRSQIKAELIKYGIPVNKPLLIAYGRPDEYKGMELTLKASAEYAKKHNMFAVMIASKFSNEPIVEKIQERLAAIVAIYPEHSMLITGIEYRLPKYLLQWPRSKVLACLSIRDYAPLVPYEAALLGHKNLNVIVSDIPCFNTLLKDGKNIYKTKLNLKSVMSKLEQVISDKSKTAKVTQEFHRFATDRCDITDNYALGLSQILPSIYESDEFEQSAGGLIVSAVDGRKKILMVRNWDGYSFPKGHIISGEKSIDSALREIREETGYHNLLNPKLIGVIERRRDGEGKNKIAKRILMYRFDANDLRRGRKAEEKFEWLGLKQAIAKMKHPEDRDFLVSIAGRL